MFLLATCYVTVFLLLIIITLSQGIWNRVMALLLGGLFFFIIHFLVLSQFYSPLLLVGLLLYLSLVTLGGYLVHLQQRRQAGLEEKLKDLSRKEAQMEEQVGEGRFFLQMCPDILYRLQVKPRLFFQVISSGITDLTGYSPREFQENPSLLSQITPIEDSPSLQDLQTGKISPQQRLLLAFPCRKDPGVVYLHLHHFPILDREEQLVAVAGMARDVTPFVTEKKDWKNMYCYWKEGGIFPWIISLFQDEKKSNPQILQEVVEAIPKALSAEGKIGARILYQEEVYQSPPPFPRTCLFQTPIPGAGALLLYGESALKEGSTAPLKEDLWRLLGEMMGVFLEGRGKMAALAQRVEEHSHLLAALDVQIWTLVDPCTYGWVNQAHGAFYHRSPQEMAGQDIEEILPQEPIEHLLQGNQEVFQGKKTVSFTHWVLDKEGERRLFYVVKTQGGEREGQPCIFCWAYDVSLGVKLEKDLSFLGYHLSTLFSSSPWGLIIQDGEGKITSWNQACQDILGYTQEEFQERGLSLIPAENTRDNYDEDLLAGESIRGLEYQWQQKDGTIVYVLLSCIPVCPPGGGVIGTFSILFDITQEKMAQAEALYLNQYDERTGLYSREYMEEEMKRLDGEGQVPISIIIGDVNGLRLINDAFGHAQGNKVLQAVAELLQEICRERDLIGRWGADEFLLLLPGTTREEAERICTRLRQADLDHLLPIPISLVFTCSTKTQPGQNLGELVQSTSQLLYQEHQGTIQSARDTILATMIKMLSSVSDETEDHTWRMQWLALEMGEWINLSEMEMERLSLLVALHDIGKITIDKKILVKEEVCSLFDWKRIKTHCAAGYLIARSSEAFAHVADAIMSHHEWWDGSGYPRGRRGGEIPVICRVFSIIDAYDSMTHRRRYGKDLSPEEAISELKKGRGIQFDPHLVDVFVSRINTKHQEKMKRGMLPSRPMTAQQQLESSYEQIQALSRRLLHAQEEELASVARDLHDDIGQNLTALKLELEILHSEISPDHPPLKKRMKKTIDLMDSVIEHIRQQISALRPPVLDDIGLLAAIQGILKRYQGVRGMEMVLRHEEMEQRFSREVETVLYRCVQESITNVIRHSQATRVEVDLIFDREEITTRIWDNGCGFQLQDVEISSDHIGLTGMKERVQLINGNITILSQPGEGTEVFISVPVNS